MRFTAIDTSAWEELKKSIEELALCMREHFGMKPELPDLLHNGDVCRILNISKRTLQHYRDTSVLPFIQIGHKCYSNVRMWKHSSPSPTANNHDYGIRND